MSASPQPVPDKPAVVVHPCTETLPAELKALPQWVCWRYMFRDGEWKKTPRTPLDTAASSTNPSTWSDFATVAAAFEEGGFDGVGFVFTERDPFVCWDFDEKKAPELPADLMERALALDSYTERSVGGVGLHVILRGVLPGKGRKANPYEVYDRDRFMALTGHRIERTPPTIESRQTAHDALYAIAFSKDGEKPARLPLEQGATLFGELISGDIRRYGDDESAADFALCKELFARGFKPAEVEAFWKRVLPREKLNRLDYIERTLRAAVAEVPQVQASTASAFRLERAGHADVIEPEQYLIEDLLPLGTLGFLYGLDQTYKTFVLLDWLLCVATGTPWHGFKVRKGVTVLIAGEGRKGLDKRIMAWCLANLGRRTLPDDALFYRSTEAAAFCDGGNADQVRAELEAIAARHGGIAIVGVDTLARNSGAGKESSPDDLKVTLNIMQSVIVQPFDAVAATVHHVGHMNQERMRGGSNAERDSDWRWRFERPDPDARVVTMTCGKMKDDDIPAPLTFELDVQELPFEKRPGTPMTSLVPRRIEAPENNAGALYGMRKLLRDALVQRAAEQAETLRTGGHDVPSEVLVDVEDAREHFITLYEATGGRQKPRKAWFDAKQHAGELFKAIKQGKRTEVFVPCQT